MAARDRPVPHPDDGFVLITRVFDAPRERVFAAWTAPEHLVRWYAPTGCTVEIYELDLRPGGRFRHRIRNPGSHDCLCTGVYREIVPPDRLVYTLSFADEEGNLIEPVQAGMDPDWPRETTVTVTFADREGKTEVTLRQTVLDSTARRTGAHPSWLDMLDRLAGELAAA
jgi:uncharacterized protein YndB with AHSA1/START domain